MLGKLAGKLFGHAKRQDVVVNQLMSEARALFGQGALAAAYSKVTLAIELQPDNGGAFHLQGILLSMHGDQTAALESFQAALKLDQKNPELYLSYGNALRLATDLENAEVAYRQAIHLAPNWEQPPKALGSLLLDLKRPAEAASAYRRALEILPDDTDALRGIGKAIFRSYDFAVARDLLLPLHKRNLLDVEGRYFLGMAFIQTGNLQAAGEVLEATLAIAPEESAVAQALSFKHLLSGNWPEGFRLYERRHESMRANPEIAGMKAWIEFLDVALAGTPAWTEGNCTGKRLLVWTEQGLGDAIMLLRLLQVLRDEWHAAEVTFLSPPPLKALVPGCEDIRFIVADPSWKALPGQFDAHCSIMSLPHLMGISPQTIPGRVPYISVPAQARAHWRDQVAILPGLRVGLAWAGSPNLKLDALRSLSFDELSPLFACAGVSFVSLQKDDAAREELRAKGFPITDWMDRCADFMDTAALIENLDLVISVDTAVVHLAGALGNPVWLLNRFESEWRWMRDREDSVWYPSMRIFNQVESRNWGPVVDQVAAELSSMVSTSAKARAAKLPLRGKDQCSVDF